MKLIKRATLFFNTSLFKRMTKIEWLAPLLILAFFSVNLLGLMDFPTIHSDELWLKGIADEMKFKGSFSVTEPFFDVYPRVVHPFRWLYNSALILSMKFFGGKLAAVRLVSLVFGTLCLSLMYKISKSHFKKPLYALVAVTLMALDIQFIYSAHMGRQETFILFLLLLGYWMIIKNETHASRHLSLRLSILVLLGLGVHPNSFIMGVVFAALLFLKWLMRETNGVPLVKFIAMTSCGVIFYLIIGYFMNPDFISGYFEYGSTLGVDAPLLNRFEGFYWYFHKLFYQIGGTYDLFNIKLQLMFLAAVTLLWTPRLLWALLNKSKRVASSLFYSYVTLVAISISLLIIGRYNQTAFVFLVPFIIISLLQTVHEIGLKISPIKKSPLLSPAFLALLVTLWGLNLNMNFSDYETQRFYEKSYEDMLLEISKSVPKDAVILGNLNIIEAFNPHKFYDIRNLGYLSDTPHAFQEYVESRDIEYIILHEEMDYITRTSPKWDLLYGQPKYVPEMQLYLENHTTRLIEIENPIYAMRISKYSGTFPWKTIIYKVIE